MTEPVILALVTAAAAAVSALVALAGTAIQAYVALQLAKIKAQADDAAVKVATVAAKAEQVKSTLEATTASTVAKLDGLATVARATHVLVNRDMGKELRDNRDVKRRLAEITGLPVDVAAADAAEIKYQAHVAKQAEVDAQPGTDEEKSGKA